MVAALKAEFHVDFGSPNACLAGSQEAALKYIEAGERAAIDYIPKIEDRVFSSEDMKEGI